MKLFYVAHPVGAGPDRRENLERAMRWFLWLVETFPEHAFTMPWWPYCAVLDESPENRDRGIRDDLEALKRCDGIVLCGSHVSPGMERELEIATECGLEKMSVLDENDEPIATDPEGIA